MSPRRATRAPRPPAGAAPQEGGPSLALDGSPGNFPGASEFAAPSWHAWQQRVWDKVTPETRSVFVIGGRGSGKSRQQGRQLAAHVMRHWPRRAPGELIACAVVCPTRAQSRLVIDYARALVPPQLIGAQGADFFELPSHGTRAEVMSADSWTIRGRSLGFLGIDEASFMPTETSHDPASEILRAARPALDRVPGSLLFVTSTAYRRAGLMWDASQRYGRDGQDGGDKHTVFVRASTVELNPLYPPEAVERERAQDPANARAEYDSLERDDIENVLTHDALAAVRVAGRLELPPGAPGLGAPHAFYDASGGSHDSAALAIAATALDTGRRVLLLAREYRAPHNPVDVVKDAARVLASYGIRTLTGDRYSGDFARALFAQEGIELRPSERDASEIFRDMIQLVNTKSCELLDSERLVSQLSQLERRVSRGSNKEIISHPPNGHDDLAVACAGALSLAWTRSGITWSPRPGTADGIFGSGLVATGVDERGREWRSGVAWSGRFPELIDRDPKGRALTGVPIFKDGKVVGHEPLEQAPPMALPKVRRVIWG